LKKELTLDSLEHRNVITGKQWFDSNDVWSFRSTLYNILIISCLNIYQPTVFNILPPLKSCVKFTWYVLWSDIDHCDDYFFYHLIVSHLSFAGILMSTDMNSSSDMTNKFLHHIIRSLFSILLFVSDFSSDKFQEITAQIFQTSLYEISKNFL
jgi:hypothetical protein